MDYYANDAKKVQIKAPIDGEVFDISMVDDYVFSKKLAGDGVAMKVKTGKVTSPVDGIVRLILHTKNGIGIETNDGVEILLHINVEKVNNGKGFCLKVKEGDKVAIGDEILYIDDDVIENEELILCVVVTNMNDVKDMHKCSDTIVSKSDTIFEVIK